jgi:hypothetical protein
MTWLDLPPTTPSGLPTSPTESSPRSLTQPARRGPHRRPRPGRRAAATGYAAGAAGRRPRNAFLGQGTTAWAAGAPG